MMPPLIYRATASAAMRLSPVIMTVSMPWACRRPMAAFGVRFDGIGLRNQTNELLVEDKNRPP
jgi:hypothetical protein